MRGNAGRMFGVDFLSHEEVSCCSKPFRKKHMILMEYKMSWEKNKNGASSRKILQIIYIKCFN